MIDHSPLGLVLIRTCAVLLQYAPLIEAALATGLAAHYALSPLKPSSRILIPTCGIVGLFTIEVAYALTLYWPHRARHRREAKYPVPLTSAERNALFERCLENVPDKERYFRLWFLGAETKDIQRENVKEFLLWAFFDTDGSLHGRVAGIAEDGPMSSGDVDKEVEGYLDRTEELLGRKLPPGRGTAKSLRLTIDGIDTRYRSVIWYGIVSLVDFVSHSYLVLHGFQYYSPPLRKAFGVFPPRVQALPSLLPIPGLKKSRSASGEIGYWLRPHTSKTRLPIVFIHGIGIGLWPYLKFLSELNAADDDGDNGQIGILALEILPISMRLTSPVLPQDQFIAHITAILGQHSPQWNEFILVSHSYGSVLTTHMLRSPSLGPRIKGLVLVDPVSVLLHLPDVAYNFTRRWPRTANEWQLWYFASMDLGVAEGLGRHFFWRENIIWREELSTLHTSFENESALPYHDEDATGGLDNEDQRVGGNTKRRVAVFLSGNDLIVDTKTVSKYLLSTANLENVPEDLSDFDDMVVGRRTDKKTTYRSHVTPSGLALSWFPRMDHAQIFEHMETRKHVLDVIKKICLDKR